MCFAWQRKEKDKVLDLNRSLNLLASEYVCVQGEEGLLSMLDFSCWNEVQQLTLDICSLGRAFKKCWEMG